MNLANKYYSPYKCFCKCWHKCMIAVLIYIDRTALFIKCIYFICYHCYYFFLCVVQYMCLSCSINLVSICANKEIYNKTMYPSEH